MELGKAAGHGLGKAAENDKKKWPRALSQSHNERRTGGGDPEGASEEEQRGGGEEKKGLKPGVRVSSDGLDAVLVSRPWNGR